MAFPTIPTVADGRVLVANQANTTAVRTFPDLSGLTKNAGDLLIAICVVYQSSAAAGAVFSGWSAGWTEFKDAGGTTSNMSIGLAYKWSTGSETGTIQVTQAATIVGFASMILLSIPGAHPSTPPEAGAIANGTSGAADPVSFDPSGWAAEDTLWIAVAGSGETSGTGTWTAIASAPTNYTGLVDTAKADTSTVGECEAAVAFRQLNASAEDVGPFSVDTSNARNSALLIAVRPAALTPVSGTDSGSGSDSSAQRTFASGSDTGSGADTSTLVIVSQADVSWAFLEVPDSPNKVGADTGSGTGTSAVRATYARTETGAGADASRLTVPKAASDTGTGSDTSAEHASYSATQPGAGADTSAERAVYAVAQPGAGADTSSEHAAYLLTQAGTGTETSTGHAAYARTEAGAGADASSLQTQNAKHGADVGTGADSTLLVARLTRTDAGSGADTSQVAQGAVSKAGTDTGSGGDSSSLRASLVKIDTSVGNDLTSILARLSRVDAGIGTEASQKGLARVDVGVGADTSTRAAVLLVTDTSTVIEAASVIASILLVETGAGVDDATVFTGVILPARITATVERSVPSSTVGLNRGGESSTIVVTKDEAEVTRWP